MDKTENMNFSRAFMDFLGRMQLAIPFGVSACVVYKFMNYRNFLGITFILSSITIVMFVWYYSFILFTKNIRELLGYDRGSCFIDNFRFCLKYRRLLFVKIIAALILVYYCYMLVVLYVYMVFVGAVSFFK